MKEMEKRIVYLIPTGWYPANGWAILRARFAVSGEEIVGGLHGELTIDGTTTVVRTAVGEFRFLGESPVGECCVESPK